MRTIIVRADVEIDIDDLDMDEIIPSISTAALKEELANRGVRELAGTPDDSDKILETISWLLNVRPEDRRNKAKIVAAIIEL